MEPEKRVQFEYALDFSEANASNNLNDVSRYTTNNNFPNVIVLFLFLKIYFSSKLFMRSMLQ